MKNKYVYAAWGALYILTAALGFLPQSTGYANAARVLLGLIFFVPGVLLLFRGLAGSPKTLCVLRLICGASLVLTLVALVANFLTVLAPDALANAMHIFLGIASAPMLCMGHWAWSIFLWACLLTASFVKLPKK